MNIQVGETVETVETQFVPVEDEEQLAEVSVASLQDNGNNSSASDKPTDLSYNCFPLGKCFHMYPVIITINVSFMFS